MDHSLYVTYLCFVTSLRDNFMFPCTLKTLKTEYIIYIYHLLWTFCPEQMMQLHTTHSFLNVLTAGVKFCNLL